MKAKIIEKEFLEQLQINTLKKCWNANTHSVRWVQSKSEAKTLPRTLWKHWNSFIWLSLTAKSIFTGTRTFTGAEIHDKYVVSQQLNWWCLLFKPNEQKLLFSLWFCQIKLLTYQFLVSLDQSASVHHLSSPPSRCLHLLHLHGPLW